MTTTVARARKYVGMEDLNRMSIEDARKAIIGNLITTYKDICKSYDLAQQKLNKNKVDVSKAKAEGDTSENAQYDTSLSELAFTTGNIIALKRQIENMSNIKEPTYMKENRSQYVDNEINILLKSSLNESAMSKYIASIFGTSFEGIVDATEEQLSQIIKYYNELPDEQVTENETKIVTRFVTYVQSMKIRPYNPCGMVMLYSAVRIQVLNSSSDERETYTFMLCPDGVSFAEYGIVALNSVIGSNILKKSINADVTINNKLSYKILEIY